ncbi:MAG: hypothetical protein AAGE88_00745 [Actinomycetota bacterium]
MGRSTPESDVELLESSAGPATPSYQRVATSTPRAVMVGLGLVLVGVVGWLIISALDGGDATAPPTTAPPAPTTTAPIETERQTTTSQTVVVPGRAVLNAVVSSPTGGGAWLVTVGENGASDVVDLPDLTEFSFDASGQWVAGIGVGIRRDRLLTLWVGRVGMPMEPISGDIASYAWHDERPGELAWTDVDRGEVRTLDLTTGVDLTGDVDAAVVTRGLETSGRLRGWGDWGFAVETWAGGTMTAVVDPDGVVLEDLPGEFRGRLADGDLVFIGDASAPVRYSPSTDATAPVPWLADGDDVSRLLVAADGLSTVAFVLRDGRTSAPSAAEVVVVSADDTVTVGLVEGDTSIALDDDGAIALVDQDPSGRSDEPSRFTLLVNGAAGWSAPVPDVFMGREWVVALALM